MLKNLKWDSEKYADPDAVECDFWSGSTAFALNIRKTKKKHLTRFP